MKDEIKEILKCLEMDMLDNKQIEKLLYYITNLQEELEKVSGSHFQLFQENKILKEERKTLYKYTPEKGFRLVDDEDVKD